MKFSKTLALALSLSLCLSLLPARASEAAPVSDSSLSISALTAMEIVSGYPDGNFYPDLPLTRAQFCKLVVLTAGWEDQLPSARSQSLFDDVPSSHWASAYITLACQKGLVHGYGNGSFGPEDPVTLAQASKVLLTLLGYSTEDIGPFYPDDYLSKASSLALTDSSDLSDHPLTRGETADLLYRLLLADTASGQTYRSTLAKTVLDDVVLLDAASSTFADAHSVTDYTSTITLPSALEGQMGSLLLDEKNRVLGFLPTDSDALTLTVSFAEADSLAALSGETISLDEDTPVILDDAVEPYSASWFALTRGDRVTLFYDCGEVSLILVSPAASTGASQILGRLESASPSLKSASSITVSGCALSLTASGKTALQNFSIGDLVSVTLNSAGDVMAISSGSGQSQVGYATVNRASATVAFPGGTISGDLTSATQSVQDLSGSLVTVRLNSDGELTLTALSTRTYTQSLDLTTRTFGSASLSSSVAVYERVGTAPATKIDLSDLLLSTVPAEKIEYVGYDSSGQVDLLLLQDVTGDRYTYGLLTKSTKTSGSGAMTASNSALAVESKNGLTDSYICGFSFSDGAFGGAAFNDISGKTVALASLTAVENLTRADFSGSTSLAGLPLADDVQCYVEASSRFVTLAQARAWSDSFTAYLDRPASEGGQVRILVAH